MYRETDKNAQQSQIQRSILEYPIKLKFIEAYWDLQQNSRTEKYTKLYPNSITKKHTKIQKRESNTGKHTKIHIKIQL